MKANKLFDWVLREAAGDSGYAGRAAPNELEADADVLNEPLESVFDGVLKACGHENSFDYTSLSVNKKAVPYGR